MSSVSTNYYIQVQYSSPEHFLTAVYFAKYAFAIQELVMPGFYDPEFSLDLLLVVQLFTFYTGKARNISD